MGVRGTLRLQLLQNIFPGHVEAVRRASHASTMRLLLHLCIEQVSLVVFHIAHKHARPAWLYYGSLQPGDLILEEQTGGVTPPIVVR